MKLLRLIPAIVITFTAQAYAASIVTEWNDVFLQAVRDVKFGPPQTARAGAIVHTCIYDAWACYSGKANGSIYYGFFRRPAAERTDANKAKAISYAAYRALVDLFPTQKASFDAKMAQLTFDPADTSTDLTTPTGIGNVVSSAVISPRHFDRSNQLGDLHTGAYSDYTGYVPVNPVIPLTGPTVITDPNRWSPLQFSDGAGGFRSPGFLVPHWGNVKSFALKPASQFRPIPPATFQATPAPGTSNDAYIEQAQLIIRTTANLTDRQKAIAEYWADGPASETPPGHWNLLTHFVSTRDANDVDADAKLYFALNNAELDASIAVWDAKRFYDSERPITAIRFLKAGKTIKTWGGTPAQPATVLGENWKPFQPDTFLTPPFPEYTSGHSCFSSAAATILKLFTGSSAFGASATIAAGSSKIQPGTVPATAVTLTWATFNAAAAEAGISRIYGGIHFPQANVASQQMGKQIGNSVWTKCLRMFNGETSPGVN